MRQPLGRNSSCWCGSGRKYKKCHLTSDQQMASAAAARSLLVLQADEREEMRIAGRFNAALLDHIRPHVCPGITTVEIDQMVKVFTEDHGHRCATLGYRVDTHQFPAHCCTSVNNVVCHGIPDAYVLQSGDIINIDVTSIVDGWHGDQSETFLVGDVGADASAIVQCAFDALHAGIAALQPYCTVNVIGQTIEQLATERGYAVVRDYCGHGVGRKFHQAPSISHAPTTTGGDFILEPGMCFTIEPMINVGGAKVSLDEEDKWTVRTVDGSLSAQFEHTILMTEDGPEILTQTAHGPVVGHCF